MVKDDTDIIEWITYHNRIGVGKFYVYDNMSKPPLQSLLQPFIDNNLVSYEYTYGANLPWYKRFVNRYIVEWRDPGINKQSFIDDKCARENMHKHQWLGYLDTDEFVRFLPYNRSMTSIGTHSLGDVLDRAAAPDKNCAGILMIWKVYGSSGYIARPNGGVLGHYSQCHDAKMQKAISQTKYMTGKTCIHDVQYTQGQSPCRSSELRLDHYAIKSWEDFQIKMKRGSGNSVKRGKDYFDGIDRSSTETCNVLHMPQKGSNTV
jgi:hypothetical protein